MKILWILEIAPMKNCVLINTVACSPSERSHSRLLGKNLLFEKRTNCTMIVSHQKFVVVKMDFHFALSRQ